jgi:NAD(P)-dependent dehydrogenase (short-subunit alcohol dehydrogenase family)
MKTILITGASRGIGLATANLFLSNGYRVLGTSTSGEIPITDPNFTAIQLQLSSEESIEHAVEVLKKEITTLDVLINNAAIAPDTQTIIPNLDMLQEIFRVNVFGTISLTELLLQHVPVGGHVINVSSSCGSFSDPVDDDTSLGYRMSKASLNMYTRSLALRLAEKSIVVSSLDPGWVSTDMGNRVATETEKPQQTPEGTAKDIFALATTCTETGCFWRFGKKRPW